MTIGHNDDGSKSIWVGASISATGGYGVSASIGTTFDLNTIPRYASFNGHRLDSTKLTSIDIAYNSNKSLVEAQSSINGGSWKPLTIKSGTWNSPNNTVVYTLSGLNPNTTYTIQTRIAHVSGLWTYSGQLSVTTKDIARITSAPDLNIGDSHDITWSNPSGSETSLKLCQTDGTLITDYGTVTDNIKNVTPDAETIYALTPDSNTITLRYIITTAGTYTAYKDCVFTVINSNPIFEDFEYQDINSKMLELTGDSQILVRGYSNVEGIVVPDNKATAINSATMKSYKLLIGDKSATVDYSDSEEVKATINAIGNNIIDMYAIDSRGNSTKVSKTATIKDYTNIKITSVTAIRENNVGEAVTLSFEGKFWNENFGSVDNVVTSCIYKYKETSSSKYIEGETELTYTVDGEKITGSVSIKGDLGAKGFEVSNSYNIQVILTDKITEDSYEITLGSGTPAIAIYKNNVAIGQKYDEYLGGALQVRGKIYQNGQPIDSGVSGDTLPIGSIAEFPSDIIPENWLLCNGQEVSRTDYPELFGILRTTYGEGDGSTTFNLPNYKGRVAVGKDESDTDFGELGKTGGEKKHTLTTSEMPSHYHRNSFGAVDDSNFSGGKDQLVVGDSNNLTGNTSAPTDTRGGDQPHNNLQPYITTNFIIKAKQSAGLVATVVDNLQSESQYDALSANQGRILNEKFKRRIITAWVDRKSFTVSESWGSINLAPFDSYVSNTDKLIVTNSGIVIGEGVSKVLVSAHSKGINHYAFPGDTVFGLRQNNNEIQNSYMTNLNSWCSQSMPATLLNCKEGDVFSIYLTSGGTGTGELLGESLTIEIIE